jgi:hypothetical protein
MPHTARLALAVGGAVRARAVAVTPLSTCSPTDWKSLGRGHLPNLAAQQALADALPAAAPAAVPAPPAF